MPSDVGRDRALQRALHLLSQRSHLCAQAGAAQCAGLELISVAEHDAAVVEQLAAVLAGRPGALSERDELAQQVRLTWSST